MNIRVVMSMPIATLDAHGASPVRMHQDYSRICQRPTLFFLVASLAPIAAERRQRASYHLRSLYLGFCGDNQSDTIAVPNVSATIDFAEGLSRYITCLFHLPSSIFPTMPSL